MCSVTSKPIASAVPAYLIVETKLVNPEARSDYAEYIRQVRPMVERYGGRYKVRGGAIQTLAGDWTPEKIVVIEFPSRDALLQWWNSSEYQSIKHLRENAVAANAIIVEGCTDH